MPLTPGTRLGPYEIAGPLGAGGMGEVFRARDTRLDRDVAIKVLPGALAQDPDRLARFEREAKALAALNHPNIAAIYGVEEGALVMELVEGEDLAGPLPLDTALEYARQIAEALEAAHEKGIVHRDLKPGNIRVTPQGVVKVLDFGLAAMTQNSGTTAGDAANSPTLTMRATEAGVIMGTAGYMSPEQAAGKPVDRRADIWSFGVVLWEMLSGRRLFHGETVSHTLADVLRSEIDFAALPGDTPAGIRALLRRCLDRNVKNRLRDIGEARVAIDQAKLEPGGPAVQAASRVPARLPWIVSAAAILGMAAFAWLAWRGANPALRPLDRFDLQFSVPSTGVTGVTAFLALSPDGRRIVYAASGKDGIIRLHARLLDQAEAVPLAGTENAQSPFFSPDGQWLAFAAEGALKKILLQGGSAVRLCDAVSLRGGAWGEDGNIVFTPDNTSPLYRVSSAGGAPQRLTELKNGERTHRYPQILPGGRAVLFTADATLGGGSIGTFEDSTIQILDFATGEVKTVHRGGYFARYVPSGHLLWAHESALFAAAVDLKRGQLKSAPIPILDKLAAHPGSGRGNFEVSPAGILVAATGEVDTVGGTLSLAWLDPGGKTQPLAVPPGQYGAIRFSPDGKRLAIMDLQKRDIMILELDRQRLFPLTFMGQIVSPIWSPDGKHIAFATVDKGFYWVRADGSSQPQPLYTPADRAPPFASSFSPDGRRLIFGGRGGSGRGLGLRMLPLDLTDPERPKAGNPEPLLPDAVSGTVSPDGRWLAYTSARGGGQGVEIFVQPFPLTGGKWRIGEGNSPAWGSGRELYFVSQRRIMAAQYRAEGNSFVAESPRAWSPHTLSQVGPGGGVFAMAPDGKRAIVLLAGSGENARQPETRLTFLLNLTDELKRRLPEGSR